MRVWLLYYDYGDGDNSGLSPTGTELLGVFTVTHAALNYARKHRHSPHQSDDGGPLIMTDDTDFVRLNGRYFMRRQEVDPQWSPHACDGGCVTAIG